ncbi:hypothetical protein Y1Q_0020385 [Alligator mississippiensis]|uniref:Uncharacterized protein n=1 Tax=Alligator mississippiensis TaxID=8496 RepID=A0A151N6H8_ALLMI|nr:hypothetical protein Y1Q_0020385 [Alligator mississippiensis]
MLEVLLCANWLRTSTLPHSATRSEVSSWDQLWPQEVVCGIGEDGLLGLYATVPVLLGLGRSQLKPAICLGFQNSERIGSPTEESSH